ncbi:hypothetical protein HYU06_00655 [Candidatus Woesearchaeota archaeon]|nr:hypothetical protein [Candidatus Woesearchaeota archaeon]
MREFNTIKKTGVIFLLAVALFLLLSALGYSTPDDCLSNQDSRIEASWRLFHKNSQGKYTTKNEVKDGYNFLKAAGVVKQRLTECGGRDYYKKTVSVSVGGSTTPIYIDDIYDLMKTRAEALGVLTEYYLLFPDIYRGISTDKVTFELHVKIPDALNTYFESVSGYPVIYAEAENNRLNPPAISFVEKRPGSPDSVYVYRGEVSLFRDTENVIFRSQIYNGFGLKDFSASYTKGSSQSINLIFEKLGVTTHKLVINTYAEADLGAGGVEKRVIDGVVTDPNSLPNDLVSVYRLDGSTRTKIIDNKRATFTVDVAIGSNYEIEWKDLLSTQSLQREMERYTISLANVSTTESRFENVYKLQKVTKPITVSRRSSNSIEIIMPIEFQSQVNFNSKSNYLIHQVGNDANSLTIQDVEPVTKTSDSRVIVLNVGNQQKGVQYDVWLITGAGNKFLGRFVGDAQETLQFTAGSVTFDPSVGNIGQLTPGQSKEFVATLDSSFPSTGLTWEWQVLQGSKDITDTAQKNAVRRYLFTAPNIAGEYIVKLILTQTSQATKKTGFWIFSSTETVTKSNPINPTAINKRAEWRLTINDKATVQDRLTQIESKIGQANAEKQKHDELINTIYNKLRAERDGVKTNALININGALKKLDEALKNNFKDINLDDPANAYLVNKKAEVEQLKISFTAIKTKTENINLDGPQFKYDKAFFDTNLKFNQQPVSGQTFRVDRISITDVTGLQTGVTKDAVFNYVKKTWGQKTISGKPIDPQTGDDDTAIFTVKKPTVREGSIVTLELFAKEGEMQGKKITEFTWTIDTPLDVGLNVVKERTDDVVRPGDVLTFNIVPKQQGVDFEEYKKRIKSTAWAVNPATGATKTEEAIDHSKVKFDDAGTYTITATFDSEYADVAGVKAETQITVELPDDEPKIMLISAQAEKLYNEGKTELSAANAEKPQNQQKRDAAKKKLEDAKRLYDQLDKKFEAAKAANKQFAGLTITQPQIKQKITDIDKLIQDEYTAKPVEFAFTKPDPSTVVSGKHEVTKGAKVEFEIKVDSKVIVPNFKWVYDQSKIKIDRTTLGANTGSGEVLANVGEEFDVSVKTDDESLQAIARFKVVDTPSTKIKITPIGTTDLDSSDNVVEVNLAPEEELGFNVETKPAGNAVQANKVREGDLLETLDYPAKDKIHVKLKGTAASPATVELSVNDPTSGSTATPVTIKINVKDKGTIFRINAPKDKLLRNEMIKIGIEPATIPATDITWALDSASQAFATINNQGELIVKESVGFGSKITVTAAYKGSLRLTTAQQTKEFSVVNSLTVAFTLTPSQRTLKQGDTETFTAVVKPVENVVITKWEKIGDTLNEVEEVSKNQNSITVKIKDVPNSVPGSKIILKATTDDGKESSVEITIGDKNDKTITLYDETTKTADTLEGNFNGATAKVGTETYVQFDGKWYKPAGKSIPYLKVLFNAAKNKGEVDPVKIQALFDK